MNLPSDAPKLPKYMSRIPSRRREWKTHTNLGHAKNAITGSSAGSWYEPYRGVAEAQVFEMVDGEWQLLWDIKGGTQYCDLPWLNRGKVIHKYESFQRSKIKHRLINIFERARDFDKVAQLKAADPERPLEDQLTFDVRDYE